MPMARRKEKVFLVWLLDVPCFYGDSIPIHTKMFRKIYSYEWWLLCLSQQLLYVIISANFSWVDIFSELTWLDSLFMSHVKRSLFFFFFNICTIIILSICKLSRLFRKVLVNITFRLINYSVFIKCIPWEKRNLFLSIF